MPKLTVRTIEAAKPGRARQEIPDALLPGLYLVVQTSGAKSWAARYRHNGRPRKHTLGTYPRINLKAARELGTKALRVAAEGRDPAAEKRAAKQSADEKDSRLVDGMFKDFLNKHVKKRNGEPIRETTRRQTAQLLGYRPDPKAAGEWIKTGGGVLAHWGGRAVAEITKDDVEAVLGNFAPVTANRTLSALKASFTWRVKKNRKTLPESPCDDVEKPSPESERDRELSDGELRQVWRAADRIGFPFGLMVQLLILTGQRRGEVAGMEWAEIDFGKRLWTLPRERVKNNKLHTVPLSAQAIAVIKRASRIGERFVFTSSGEVPASNFGKNKRRLDALLPANMPAWSLHDLRRTVASGMAELGINLPVIEKVLNHISGSFAGIVAVYQHHDFADEKRKALDAWGKHVVELVANDSAKVTKSRMLR